MPEVSVYSDMLRSRLETDPDSSGRTTPELVAEVIRRRAEVDKAEVVPGEQPDGGLAAALAYDAALARLCDHLDVAHRLTEGLPPGEARRGAERALAAHLPALTETALRSGAATGAYGPARAGSRAEGPARSSQPS